MAAAEDAQQKRSHIAINVVDAGDDEPAASARCCCCVCMEPMEWVAFGRCRHRDVCAGCAIRIRFFQRDKRCCICRTYCPNVMVTHVDSRLDDLPFFAPEGKLQGRRYLYHGGIGACFDDHNQYDMATKLCVKPPPPPPRPDPEIINDVSEAETPESQQRPAAGVVDRRRNRRDEPLSVPCLAVIFVVIYLCVIMMLTIMCGLVFLTAAETTYYQKMAAVIAFGLLSATATICAIWCWPKFKDTLRNC